MKRIATIIMSVMLLSVVGWVGVASAGSVRTGTTSEVKASETIDSSFYMAGNVVKVAGVVKGDLFCAAQRVEITGTIEGDIMCAAQIMSVKGNVLGDARLAGMNVVVNANIGGSLTLASQLASIEKETKIGRDVTLGAADATISGATGRDIRAAAELFTFEGTAGRDVHVREVAEAKVGETAVIGGEFIYTSKYEAEIADGAKITGKTERLTPETPEEKPQSATLASYIMGAAFVFASMMLVALVILAAAPKALDATTQTLRRRHIWAFGLGLVVLVFTPITALVLAFTLIGGPLAVLLMLGWVTLLISASSFTAYTIGQMMSERLQWNSRWPRVTNLSLGFLVLFILGLVPVVNVVVLGCAAIWGMGGVVISMVENLRLPRPAVKAKKK